MLLATSSGIAVIAVMLVVGLIFLGTVLLGELVHWLGGRRSHARH